MKIFAYISDKKSFYWARIYVFFFLHGMGSSTLKMYFLYQKTKNIFSVWEDVQPGPQGAPSQGKLATEPEASTDQIENDQEDKSSVINESTPGQQETSQNEEKSLQNEAGVYI